MQVPARSSLEPSNVFPELKNEVFQLQKETKFPQKFFSVPFFSRKGTPVRRGRCQRDLKHAEVCMGQKFWKETGSCEEGTILARGFS